MQNIGVHYLVDIDNTKLDQLNSNSAITELCEKILKETNVTILGKLLHEFTPQGLTIIYLLSESHFSIHTWPESNCLRVDFFSCNKNTDFDIFLQLLRDFFQESTITITINER